MSLSNREFLNWKERGRGEVQVGGLQTSICKVRIGLGKIEGRDTDTKR
jgi:hypothetical protein